MYETFFGLNRRPFSATPNPNCFVAAESTQEALDELIVCVQRGQGIGILTAPPGTGKIQLDLFRQEISTRMPMLLHECKRVNEQLILRRRPNIESFQDAEQYRTVCPVKAPQ